MTPGGWSALLLAGAVVTASCAGATDDTVFTADQVRSATSTIAEPVTPVVVPATTLAPDALPPGGGVLTDTVVVDRLWSPENATAEIVGTGAVAGDVITVDDEIVHIVSFETTADGGFVAQVRIPNEGAHTVCIRDACGRVYVLDPNAESVEEVEAKIAAARLLADARFDFAGVFPEWTIEVSGPFSGTGGSTDAETKVVTIYSNRGRTVQEYERTFLHEWGHVVDAERLDDTERLQYRELRGIAPDAVWRSLDDHTIAAWGQQPSEDFAEVVAALWSQGEFVPRTSDLATPPDAEQLAAVAELAELS